MQRVHLPTFFKFGAVMSELKVIDSTDKLTEPALFQIMFKASAWLLFFLDATKDIALPTTREVAVNISELIGEYKERLDSASKGEGKDEQIGQLFIKRLNELLDEFPVLFERESRRISVFSVTPKGIYDTEKLIESAEKRFPKNLLKVMPQLTIDDMKEAGRCLAFDVPTACAFHVCRATEALMLAYYETLTGTAWAFPRRDWYNYNNQLAANGAPAAITNRLGEIREDRNAYAHPEITVPLDEAPIVFELCSGVIHLMAKEMEKIEAARVAASSPPSIP